MSLRRFFTTFFLVVLLGSISVGAIYLYNFDLNSFRTELEGIVSERIAKPFSLGNAHLSIKHGPAFAFDDVRIGSADDDLYLNVKKVFFRLQTLPLLSGEILFSEILLEDPDVSVRIKNDRSGEATFLPEKRLFTGELVKSLRIHNGTIRVTDLRRSDEPETISFENIFFSVNDLSLQRSGKIKAKATLIHRGVHSPLAMEGEYKTTEETADWTGDLYRFDLSAKHLAVNHLSPWLEGMLANFSMRGYADLALQFEGSPHKVVSFKTKLTGKNLDLVTSAAEAAPTSISEINLGGRVQYAKDVIALEDLKFKLETGRGQLEIENQAQLTLTDTTLSNIVSEGHLSVRLATANEQTTSTFFSRNITATYKIDLSRTKTGWNAKNGKLALSGLEAKFFGQWRNNKDKAYSTTIDIPDASLTAITALMPGLRRLDLDGRFDAHINLDGSASAPLRTVGTLNLTDVHLAIPGKMADLNRLNGAIQLDNSTLVAKGLRADLGRSPITVDVDIPDLAVPDVTLHILSDSIRADELIFTSDSRYLKEIDGIVRLADNAVHLGPIHVKMDGGTDATVNGTVRNFAEAEVLLDIQGRHGNIDEIIALWENKHPEPIIDKPHHKFSLTIDINTESGQISGMPFDQATSQIVLRNKTLVIGPIRFRSGDGEGKGQVLLVKQDDGSSLLKISGNVKNFDAQAVYHQLLKRHGLVSGQLSGDFYLEGIAGKQFLPTSLGGFSVLIEEGRLNKLTGLSKVLHILNLYPLLTENVQGKGLPYESITFNTNLTRGVLVTEDFLMHGDIMNLSMTGNYNIISNTVDFDMAAMPLRSVDSIISHLPIAGWILTGSKKALIVAHFEMTGSADDPDVEAVPFGSVTTPVLGILERVFTFPYKIITDPEKVLINK